MPSPLHPCFRPSAIMRCLCQPDPVEGAPLPPLRGQWHKSGCCCASIAGVRTRQRDQLDERVSVIRTLTCPSPEREFPEATLCSPRLAFADSVLRVTYRRLTRSSALRSGRSAQRASRTRPPNSGSSRACLARAPSILPRAQQAAACSVDTVEKGPMILKWSLFFLNRRPPPRPYLFQLKRATIAALEC